MRSAVENVFEVIGVLIFCLCVLSIASDYEGRSLISMFGFFAILYTAYFTFREHNKKLNKYSALLLCVSLIGLWMGPMNIPNCIKQSEIDHWKGLYQSKDATRWSKDLPAQTLQKFENGEMVLHYDLVEWAEELPDELKSDPSKGQIGTPRPRLIVHHDLTDKFVYDDFKKHWDKKCRQKLGIAGFLNDLTYPVIRRNIF